MGKSRVNPMKRAEIRRYAMKMRKFLGYKNKDWVDVSKLFDSLSIVFDKAGLKFDYEVLLDDSIAFESNEEAYTDMSTGIIYIKESVIEQACGGSFKRGVFTLVHELGHYLLHFVQNKVKLTMVVENVKVPAYCDPEWQADVFASEFLMPYEECINMCPKEIERLYHVSKKASEVRYDIIQKEKKKMN